MKKTNLTIKLQICAVTAILFILLAIVAVIKIKAPQEVSMEEYSYSNVTEQVLADEVTTYLQGAADLREEVGIKAANEAVKSYRLILQSDVDVVNEDHTQAIQERISATLREAAGEEKLTEDDAAALSAGVAEIVWRMVLSQIETVTTGNVEESEYFYLAESLQGQIKELENRKMKVSIRTNIDNNTDLTSGELLSIVEEMTDQELEELARSMGLSQEELQKLLETYQSDTDKENNSKLKELEEKLTKEIREAEGEDGKDGIQGERGEEGKTGTSGKSVFVRYSEKANGESMTETPLTATKYIGIYTGAKASTNPQDYVWSKYTGDDGKSIFIRYSEKVNGENMTEQPTSKTKYMGTYIGANASKNPSDYSWSQYVGNDGNSIFIRYATSAYGANMTKRPNSDTKYMGTYTGAEASTDPDDYTWTRYSDATISFSNGTLYITQ